MSYNTLLSSLSDLWIVFNCTVFVIVYFKRKETFLVVFIVPRWQCGVLLWPFTGLISYLIPRYTGLDQIRAFRV